jgi:hypothetical protein
VAKDWFGGGVTGMKTDQLVGNPSWGTIRAEKEGTENGCVRVFIKAWAKVELGGPYGNVKVNDDPARTTLSSFTASLQTLPAE